MDLRKAGNKCQVKNLNKICHFIIILMFEENYLRSVIHFKFATIYSASLFNTVSFLDIMILIYGDVDKLEFDELFCKFRAYSCILPSY